MSNSLPCSFDSVTSSSESGVICKVWSPVDGSVNVWFMVVLSCAESSGTVIVSVTDAPQFNPRLEAGASTLPAFLT